MSNESTYLFLDGIERERRDSRDQRLDQLGKALSMSIIYLTLCGT